jgi:hypothetical protein
MRTIFRSGKPAGCKFSVIFLDWSCRESFHSLKFLADQNINRDEYEIIWIEYYSDVSSHLREIIDADITSGRPPSVDQWIVMDMDEEIYYHKHLMYNIGVYFARGQYVIISDSDAMYEPGFFADIEKRFASNDRIVYHIDQIRNERQDFYPFNYPSFDDVKGQGVINFVNGKTTGLWDTDDVHHTRNYGACFVAKREDVIAAGGADEAMDFVGHVCGPYDLTFRLANNGLTEIWSEDHFTYHTWHPGSDGDFNYIGPSDGRNMSSTALEALKTGRVMPLKENAGIKALRTGEGLESAIENLIDPDYHRVLLKEEIVKSPLFTLFKRPQGQPRLIGESEGANIVFFRSMYYVILQSLGPIDFETMDESQIQGVDVFESADEANDFIARTYGSGAVRSDVVTEPDADPAPTPTAKPAAARAAQATQPDHALPHQDPNFDIRESDGVFIAVPLMLKDMDTETLLRDHRSSVLTATSRASLSLDILHERVARLTGALRSRSGAQVDSEAKATALAAQVADLQTQLTEESNRRRNFEKAMQTQMATVRERDLALAKQAELVSTLRREIAVLHLKAGQLDLLKHGTFGAGVQVSTSGLTCRAEKTGRHVVYGPYATIPPGLYELAFDIQLSKKGASGSSQEPIVHIDVVAGETVILHQGFKAEDLAKVDALTFQIPRLEVAAPIFEVRLHLAAGEQVQIRKFSLDRLDASGRPSLVRDHEAQAAE